jgi:hypothetical protein
MGVMNFGTPLLHLGKMQALENLRSKHHVYGAVQKAP